MVDIENRITEMRQYLEEQHRVLAIETNDLKKPTMDVVSEDDRYVIENHPSVMLVNLGFAIKLLEAVESDRLTFVYPRVETAMNNVGNMRRLEWIMHERESMDAPDTKDDGDSAEFMGDLADEEINKGGRPGYDGPTRI